MNVMSHPPDLAETPELDSVFTAVSSPVRRDILLRLADGPQRVGDLASRYAMSLNAVSKHIKTLESAQLVTRRIQGREHLLTANPHSLLAAMAWMRHYEQFWNERLDALTAHLESHQPPTGSKAMMLVSPQSPLVVVRRFIHAPVARVFAAWSEPATLAVFMRPCSFTEFESDVQVDFRVGGAFRIVMRTAERQIPHTGVYQVIKPLEQLVFTWTSQYAGEDSLVTVDFREVGEATELVLRHQRLPNEAEGRNHTNGWTDILGNLDKTLAGPQSAAADGFRMDLPMNASAAVIYAALTEASGLRGWWTRNCDVGTGVGELCTVRFDKTWKVLRIEDLKPDSQVRWRCIEAHLDCPGLTRADEWEGTVISFTLEPQSPTSTLLRFAHTGLVPMMECHGICTTGWRQFLGSLRQYVEIGTGSPF